jgi:acylphosphatase
VSDLARVVATVSGHVQGVGYRYFVRGLAIGAGLAGGAQNLRDGRVEVILEGPGDAVRAVVAELDGADAPGTVSRVDVRAEPVRGGRGFTVT